MRKQYVEDRIRKYIGRRYCFLVGRGSTAIYLALKAVEKKIGTGEVVLPTISCTSPANAVYYAGFTPVFADVTATDFTIDIKSLKKMITEETKALLPIHIYGHCASMNEVLEIAREKGIYVIEDAAQSLGGRCGTKKTGGIGEISILSFGNSKIIEAGGGGAILTDDREIAEIVQAEVSKLPFHSVDFSYGYSIKSQIYRNIYHSLVGMLRLGNNTLACNLFREVIDYFRDMYLFQFPASKDLMHNIFKGFESLDGDNEKRIERANLYNKLLCHEDITHPKGWDKSGVVWRYSVLVREPQKLKYATEKLRENGIHASNLYWSVEDLFYTNSTNENSSYIGPRILNLWVDSSATVDYVQKSCEILLNSLE